MAEALSAAVLVLVAMALSGLGGYLVYRMLKWR
jgi:hypothetical protein